MRRDQASIPTGLATRVAHANAQPVNSAGRYVLYWMIAARRTTYHPGLEHALSWCARLGRPLLVLEALRLDYPWASARLHAFVMAGMRDNAAAFAAAEIAYLPYVEPTPGSGKGLLRRLAHDACVVVTDEFPCFFLPSAVRAAAAQAPVALETVDSNGIMPLRAFPRAYTTAASFRWAWQKVIAPYLIHFPAAAPLLSTQANVARGGCIPDDVLARWPAAALAAPGAANALAAQLPIDQGVAISPIGGGPVAAAAACTRFIEARLARYATDRSQPDAEAASGLSPYLHFGHISTHEVVAALMRAVDWTPALVGTKANGRREGWWNLPDAPQAFLDELITWRELGYGYCFHTPDYASYASLPAWALATLKKHAADPRPHLYSPAQLDAAQTHDALWNAAQRQLRGEGIIQNYLRMLWGKKILEWSPTPQAALATMVDLNNRYALDGRNPNSYSGIFWTLGRFDRAWGPERQIFGSVRYMSSENTARKLSLKAYLRRWGTQSGFTYN
ncbi:MAG: deoxyribodipyrimidine photolyase [Myxococcales bacterium]|nr:deoxyribodipyrimidine photolyase [Myxococcales bacterium]